METRAARTSRSDDEDELLALLLEDEPSLPAPAHTSPASTAARPAVAERAGVSAEGFADEFQRRFRGREPVVLRGLASSWPAVTRWADADCFAAQLGDERIDVLTPREVGSRRFLKADCNVARRPFADVAGDLFPGLRRAGCPDGDGPGGIGAACAELYMKPAVVTSARLYARAPLSHGLLDDVTLASLTGMLLPGDFKPTLAQRDLGAEQAVSPQEMLAEGVQGTIPQGVIEHEVVPQGAAGVSHGKVPQSVAEGLQKLPQGAAGWKQVIPRGAARVSLGTLPQGVIEQGTHPQDRSASAVPVSQLCHDRCAATCASTSVAAAATAAAAIATTVTAAAIIATPAITAASVAIAATAATVATPVVAAAAIAVSTAAAAAATTDAAVAIASTAAATLGD